MMATEDAGEKNRPKLSNVHQTADLPRSEWMYLVNEKREAEAAIAEAEKFIEDVRIRGGDGINLTKSKQLMRDAYLYVDEREDYFTAMRKALEAKTIAVLSVLSYQITQNNELQKKLENSEPEVVLENIAQLTAFLSTHVGQEILEEYISEKVESGIGMSLEELLEKSKSLQEQKERIANLEQAYVLKFRDLQIKEERITARDNALQARIAALESGKDETDKIEALRELERKQQKSPIGIAYLDNLLDGGLPFGSNSMVYGPTYANKELVSNWFVMSGLKRNTPVIIILTDVGINQKRQELTNFDPSYKTYEEKGLVEYISISSKRTRRKQSETEGKYVFDINKFNPDDIFNAFENIVSNLKTRYGDNHYRLIFEYVTSVDSKIGDKFKDFFKDLTTLVKEDSAVGVYLAETMKSDEINDLSKGRTIDCLVQLDGEKISVQGLGTLEIKDNKPTSYTVRGNTLVLTSVVR